MARKKKKSKKCKFCITVKMCILGHDLCNGGKEHNCYEQLSKQKE